MAKADAELLPRSRAAIRRLIQACERTRPSRAAQDKAATRRREVAATLAERRAWLPWHRRFN